MIDAKTEKRLDLLQQKYEGRVRKRPRVDAEELPDWFHVGQQALWTVKAKIILLLAGRQSGKAQPLDTPIPTPDGWRTMGDLQVGDEVLCPDGTAAVVTGTSSVMHGHKCYRVVFDDGSSTIADADHLWKTYNKCERKNNARNGRDDFGIRTTQEIKDSLRYGKETNHSIDIPKPAYYPERELPVDPYTLGAWLGDGNSHSASITCADPQIIEEIRSAGYLCGVGRECGSGKALAYTIGMSPSGAGGDFRGRDSLTTKLRELGLKKNKHIPAEYMVASAGQRLALLQGLMDTDGYCSSHPKHSCEFSCSREDLSYQVLELIRSLGIKAKIKWRTVNGFRSSRITFTTTLPVFRLQRKLARLPQSVRSDCQRRFIVAVEEVPSVPVKCIAISHPERLYLCGRDYIPTHNTVSGPYWLRREIQRTASPEIKDGEPPNDYIVAGPTLSILNNKAIPEFLRLFPDDGEFGRYDKARNKYHLLPKGSEELLGFVTEVTIHFGYAANPESLAAMTAKAAWLDEAGQEQFKRDSFEELVSRLLITGGRMLITTTAYIATGWMRELYDRAKSGDPSIGLVQFKTEDLGRILFGKGNWSVLRTIVSAKRRLPEWKFKMWYEGEFTRPPGAIYDCFDGDVGKVGRNTCDPFPIPKEWPLYWGIDFGPVHTCVLMFAQEPDEKGKLYCYASYLPAEAGDGRRTWDQHVEAMKLKSMSAMEDRRWREPYKVWGGAKNEDHQRLQYIRRGIRVLPPEYENDVVTQIECTYSAIKDGKVVIFNDLAPLINEILSYSYKVDEDHNVDETKIRDKEKQHRCDSLRYCCASRFPGKRMETRVVERQKKAPKKERVPFRM